jgi:phosphoribosylanthranilate isomerase
MIPVKVCGITRAVDAELAAELGAAMLGFVFWTGSPRFIDPYAARRIILRVPPHVTAVGVFVDAPLDYVKAVANLLRLGAIQLHGAESVAYCRALASRVIKAVAFAGAAPVGDPTAWPPEVTLLLDASDPVRKGGTGQPIDWRAAAAVARSRRVILSGGLRPENVAEAVGQVRPYAVDVSSGVEQRPGVKDPARLRAFFEALRATSVEGVGERG